jgi:hypothetical protein
VQSPTADNSAIASRAELLLEAMEICLLRRRAGGG